MTQILTGFQLCEFCQHRLRLDPTLNPAFLDAELDESIVFGIKVHQHFPPEL